MQCYSANKRPKTYIRRWSGQSCTSRLAFEEMLDAGITTVGEFHYIHHAADEGEGDKEDKSNNKATKEAPDEERRSP